MTGRRDLPRAVWLLGWVSLLTDAASEAIYPLLPFFLATLGAGPLALGLIEGVADGASALLRVVSGRWSDVVARRKPFVVAGYALAGAVRPLMGLAASWPAVLAIRFTDRVGKGLRGAPRDALIASWTDPGDRGRAFGFHRAMDHAGAVVGPLTASAFLWMAPGQYRALFLATVIPGLLALVLALRTPDGPSAVSGTAGPDARPAGAAPGLPRRFYAYLAIVTVFALGNSADAFLLLRLGEALGTPTVVPLLWAVHHGVKSMLSTAGGTLSDRVGRRPVLAAGWLVYAAVYAGFAFGRSPMTLVAWFLAYGVYFALAEGTEKALVADMAPPALRGTAFGLFHAATGLGTLGASLLVGSVWAAWGHHVAFGVGAALALAATGMLTAIGPEHRASR